MLKLFQITIKKKISELFKIVIKERILYDIAMG